MEIWKNLFKSQWSPFVAALLIGFVNTMMFAYDSPWSVFTGLRNWGLHLLEFIPNFPDVAQISPLEYKSSVMDMAFLFGAFGSALLAKEFSIRVPPLNEAIKGIIGGLLMAPMMLFMGLSIFIMFIVVQLFFLLREVYKTIKEKN